MIYEFGGFAYEHRQVARTRCYQLNIALSIGQWHDEPLREAAQFDGPFASRIAQHELDRREELEQ